MMEMWYRNPLIDDKPVKVTVVNRFKRRVEVQRKGSLGRRGFWINECELSPI